MLLTRYSPDSPARLGHAGWALMPFAPWHAAHLAATDRPAAAAFLSPFPALLHFAAEKYAGPMTTRDNTVPFVEPKRLI